MPIPSEASGEPAAVGIVPENVPLSPSSRTAVSGAVSVSDHALTLRFPAPCSESSVTVTAIESEQPNVPRSSSIVPAS